MLLGLCRVLGIFILALEEVTVLILVLNVAFCLVLSEEATHLAAIKSEDSAAANPAIILPLTFIEIAIDIVMDTSAIPHVMLHVSLIEFTVGHEDLDLAISNFVPIEARLNNLIGQSEENTVTKWFIIAPFTLVYRTSFAKLAESST